MKLIYEYSFQKYDKRYLAIVDFTENETERRMLWVNDCGKRIMEILQEDISKEELIKKMLEYYSGEPEVIEASVNKFLKQLSEAGLLID